MAFTDPYRQHNYMGEHSSDANCLTAIQNSDWDSDKDGTGNPEAGMFYYNTTDNGLKVYNGTSWEALGSSVTLQDNIRYVGKHGNDSNDGKTIGGAKLTIQNAIDSITDESSTNRYSIVILDDGIYEELITMASYISICGPSAEIVSTNVGSATIYAASYCSVKVNRLRNVRATGAGYCVQVTTASIVDFFVDVDYMEITNAGQCIYVTSTNSLIYINAKLLRSTATSGDGIRINSSTAVVNVNIDRIDTTTSGFGIDMDDGELNGWIGFLDQNPSNGDGIFQTGGTVNLACGQIEAFRPYVLQGGELNLSAMKYSGTPTRTGGEDHFTTPAESWNRGTKAYHVALGYLDLDGSRIVFDSDADTYLDGSNDDRVDLYTGGVEFFRMDGATGNHIFNGKYQRWYNAADNEYGWITRSDAEWLFSTNGAQITLNGTNVAIKYNGSTKLGCFTDRTEIYNGWFECGDTYTRVKNTRAVYVDANGIFGTVSSSQKYKKDIMDMEDVLWIHNLRPVNFKWKEIVEVEDEGKQYGLIAEEVEIVNPAICDYNEDGVVDGVQYERLVPVLLKEVQNLRKELEELKRQMS